MSGGTLVLSPHADDEVLGCVSWLGPATCVYYVGVDEFHVVGREERLAEIAAVAELLGFSYRVGGFEVNHYDKRRFDLLQELEALVNELRPETLLIPAKSYNYDHQVVHDAALAATRHHDRNHFVGRVLVYEEPDIYLAQTTPFVPNHFRSVDIERKLRANALHGSQLRGHRAPELLQTMAEHRGRQAGLAHAEGFIALRWVHR